MSVLLLEWCPLVVTFRFSVAKLPNDPSRHRGALSADKVSPQTKALTCWFPTETIRSGDPVSTGVHTDQSVWSCALNNPYKHKSIT